MDQHTFVSECLSKYTMLGLTPGNPDDGVWNVAHYPAPDPEGTETVQLLFNDHQQQGLYQSEEWGRCCFWSGDTRKFLTHGPFVSNWFELWDIYDKWVGDRNKKLHELYPDMARRNGIANNEILNSHPNTIEARKKLNSHPNTIEAQGRLNSHPDHDKWVSKGGKEGSKTTNSQMWQCLKTGHIAPPGPLSCYQKARGIDTSLRVRIYLEQNTV